MLSVYPKTQRRGVRVTLRRRSEGVSEASRPTGVLTDSPALAMLQNAFSCMHAANRKGSLACRIRLSVVVR